MIKLKSEIFTIDEIKGRPSKAAALKYAMVGDKLQFEMTLSNRTGRGVYATYVTVYTMETDGTIHKDTISQTLLYKALENYKLI